MNKLTHQGVLPAAERLASSRERLRGALKEIRQPEIHPEEQKAGLMGTLTGLPGVGSLIENLRNWWMHHPLHMATMVAGDAAKTAVRPVVDRNPFLMVLGAMAVGAIIVKLRPWQGVLKPALMAGIVPQLIARAVAHMPFEAWIAGLNSAVSRQAREAAAEQQAHGETPAATSDPVRTSTSSVGGNGVNTGASAYPGNGAMPGSAAPVGAGLAQDRPPASSTGTTAGRTAASSGTGVGGTGDTSPSILH